MLKTNNPKIQLTEIDREDWRFVLYESEDKGLYGDFVYSPQRFIDLSMMIRLRTEEEEIYRLGRAVFLQLADRIRFNHRDYLKRQLDRSDKVF